MRYTVTYPISNHGDSEEKEKQLLTTTTVFRKYVSQLISRKKHINSYYVLCLQIFYLEIHSSRSSNCKSDVHFHKLDIFELISEIFLSHEIISGFYQVK